MAGHNMRPFEIKARRRGATQLESEESRRHTEGNRARSAKNRRSRSPLPRAARARRGETPEFDRSEPQDELASENGEPEGASDSGRLAQDEQHPRAGECVEGGLQFELESRLEVTNAALKDVEGRVAELGAARAAVEEQVKAGEAALEAGKEHQAEFHRQLQAIVEKAEKTLGDARAAVTGAEAQIESAAQEVERGAAAVAAQVTAAGNAAAEARARIGTLEAVGPGTLGGTSGNGAAAAEAAKQEAEARRAALEAKLGELREKRARALAQLIAHGGQPGKLAGRSAELEAKLKAQRDDAAKLRARAKELGVDAEKALGAGTLKEPAAAVPARRPPRLFAMSPALSDIAGEYKLLPQTACGRPVYAHKSAGGVTTYLFWVSTEGRCCWAFGKELPPASSNGIGIDTAAKADAKLEGIIARSVQATWTAHPDELASCHWDTGSAVVDITLVSAGV